MPVEIKENHPLKQLTTFEIGGPAAFYITVANLEDVAHALDFAKKQSLEVFVLGGGSNVLISDQGFAGLVIHNKIKGFEIKQTVKQIIVKIGAGEDWDSVVARCVEEELCGIECLSGIPGSAGGAVVQNIGAYGQTIQNVVYSVEAVSIKTGKIEILTPEQCAFEYRQSLFKQNPGKYIVTGFELRLEANSKPNLKYHDLINYFKNKTEKPSLVEVREAVIEIRAKKGNVILSGYEKFKTAGSFFKNPIVDKKIFLKVKDWIENHKIKGECNDPWAWESSNEKVKVAAPCLILHAGYKKGTKQGNVGISPKHPLAVVNLQDAKAAEVMAFSKVIKQAVKDKFQIDLEEEVKLVGFNYNI